MGKFHLNDGLLQSFEVQKILEPNGHEVAYVTIYTDSAENKFRISTDDRHPDLEKIIIKLEEGLGSAINEKSADIGFNEYAERSYIFVTYPDGSIEQYTGQRLK